MQQQNSDKEELDRLIKLYQDIKKSNQSTASQQETKQTGKYTPIPLPAIDNSKPENKQTKG